MFLNFEFGPVFAESGLLLHGVMLTILLSLAAIVFGTLLALLLCAARFLFGRTVRFLIDAYVEAMRNTPFLVQLFIVYFGLPFIGLRMSNIEAGLLAMVLNLAAYSTEIIRAGVDATHKSQVEAGVSLAMTRAQVFRHVVLTPALAKVWPALSSQYVLMLLASSIVSFISVEELSGAAAIIEQNTFRSFETYIVATLIYLALSLGLKALLSAVGKGAFPRGAGGSRQGGRA
jgi:polar amino acid transport system permease protein